MAAPTQPAPAGEPGAVAEGTPVGGTGAGQGLEGLTWFLRCAECHTLYEPAEVLVLSKALDTACMDVVWVRPTRKRRPLVCTHLGALERWTGKEWVATEARSKEQS